MIGQDTDYVYAVAFSPHGNMLATGNWDTTARLFDVSNPKEPRTSLNGHLRPVSGVAFSADGRSLVTTSQDTTAQLWNITNPDHPVLRAAPLAGNNDAVHSPTFSPDGHTIAMAGGGRDVRLWEIDVERAATEICATVASPLRPDQWHHYFPGREYQSTCPVRPHFEVRNDTKAPAGSTPLVASNSGKCVAIKDDGAPIGAPAHQIGCTRALGEHWMLRDAEAPPLGNTGDRVVRIVNAASNDMCLESADAERKFGDATQVVQRLCIDGNGAQLWILKVGERRADSVDVRFLGLKHSDCLNINGEATANGAYVVRWPCHAPESHTNEIFQIHPDALSR